MTTEPETITVVIPTFNRRALLERAVASVLAETRVPIRVSVFDNASSDDTGAFIRDVAARDDRVSYQRNESNVGGLRNVRNAVASVRTEYFVPLADDDLFLPDFLHDAYHVMQSQPSVGATVFSTEGRTNDDRMVAIYPEYLGLAPSGIITSAAHMRLWLRHGHCAWSSVLWRTSVTARVGLPFADIGLPGDVDFQARVFATFPAYLVNRPGAVYRVHDLQASQGFDVSHVPDWAAIFNGLDRLVASLAQERVGVDSEDVLPWNEYLELREHAWRRLRGMWSRPAATPLSAADRQRLALIAGFRLGDWPLACSLAETVDGEAPAPTGGSRLFSLPGLDIAEPPAYVQGNARTMLLAVIRWFGASSARERWTSARLADAQDNRSEREAFQQEADASRAHLEQELTDCLAREAALTGEVEALRQLLQRAEDRSLRRRAQRFVAQATGAAAIEDSRSVQHGERDV